MLRDTPTIEKYPIKVSPIYKGKGYWDYNLVEIFQKQENAEGIVKIGEYTRNYASMFRTFLPFSQDGKDYALYSPHYTATRVMTLPDCKDLCGEEPSAGGFCPFQYAIPFGTYLSSEKDAKVPFNAQWGLVSGCVWGDDSSLKLQYLDLSKIAAGNFCRNESLGYIELYDGIDDLYDAITISDCFDDKWSFMEVAERRMVDLNIDYSKSSYYHSHEADLINILKLNIKNIFASATDPQILQSKILGLFKD